MAYSHMCAPSHCQNTHTHTYMWQTHANLGEFDCHPWSQSSELNRIKKVNHPINTFWNLSVKHRPADKYIQSLKTERKQLITKCLHLKISHFEHCVDKDTHTNPFYRPKNSVVFLFISTGCPLWVPSYAISLHNWLYTLVLWSRVLCYDLLCYSTTGTQIQRHTGSLPCLSPFLQYSL